MFIDYVKRLEAHKRCQNLSLTSFLLLPMQRITRMPLLILAILNRISSDHPKHTIVEQSLRRIQTVRIISKNGNWLILWNQLLLIDNQLKSVEVIRPTKSIDDQKYGGFFM